MFSRKESSIYMLQRIKELKETIAEMDEFLTPRIHVCTQSGKSIIPVVAFFVDGTGTDDYFVMAAHKGKGSWNVLGAYPTLEKALQVYKEMLQCPRDEVYIMPER